jgi:excisionase family DNA binding protein
MARDCLDGRAAQALRGDGVNLSLELPSELVEAIAERAAVLVFERALAENGRSPWLTAQEAADYLRCSRQRVYDLKSSRQIVAAQDGKRPLFHRAVLDAYLAGGREAARAAAAALPLPAGSRSGSGLAR